MDGDARPLLERYGPWALVAGGSDGIGAAFARALASAGFAVALIGRDEDKLAKAAAALHDDHGAETRTIALDLTTADAGAAAARATDDLEVGLLVYNAGSNAQAGRFLDLPFDNALGLLDRNCRGATALAHHFGGRMRTRGRGGIVLMSSLACLAGTHGQAVYGATKAFDTLLAEALWHELAPAGVDVLAVLAGATRTETMLATGDAFDDAMDPNEVATAALERLGRGPICVPGAGNQAAARGLWPVPRVPVINAMSEASAALAGTGHEAVAGSEFHEEPG